ncbi:MAG: glutamate-5-semialdehyde dehydrogenase [Clostridiales bacterium]|nr:glutamate-5-semialdehyde dehydrogenase [Clostridiales bacterium]
MEELGNILKKTKSASKFLIDASPNVKNNILKKISIALINEKNEVLNSNEKDLILAREKNMKKSFVDRLMLNYERIEKIAASLQKIALLESPIGKIFCGRTLENKLEIYKKRVPLGVIAIIYESRPNVTIDSFGLCFKACNALILKGGVDAFNTNQKFCQIIKSVLKNSDIPMDVVNIIEDNSKENVLKLMRSVGYIDLLIARGGKNLIKSIRENAKVPYIETATGNCHVYVDKFADFDMAIKIIINAKTQRVSVCNSCESVVIHTDIAEVFLPKLLCVLREKNVEVRGDEYAKTICEDIVLATALDWEEEYLDLIISVRIVKNLNEAILHVNKYSSSHSETIVTNNYQNAREFQNKIDSAVVYVNASTRFTDGEEFGLGSELGISTQKLHVRGPIGLDDLTTIKYIVNGNGQVRES